MSMMTKDVVVDRIDVAASHMEKGEDFVAKEIPLHVFMGTIHFVSVLCSPTLLKEFVIGHLLGEGLVNSLDEIIGIDFEEENRCHVTLQKIDVERHVIVSKPFARLIVSSCGSIGYRTLSELLDTIELKPLPFWKIKAKTVLECVKRLNVLAETFRKTGGVHIAALFMHDGRLVVFAEDVGRHNAVDKVIGAASSSQQDLSRCLLVLSGRLTGDIVLKAARVGVPIVASLAAAVDSGVEVAEKTAMTLVGFVRGNRMNVYANPERIQL